ncbi:coiled-coil domain-containing protein 68 isoform X1 [Pelobates fuscus]|uniref:coiled-coil domain-containing protein 68 isoform X1 n=1 Tax=Pelobates fuscus TaxID=191477 RepID=UPI002FE48041
MGDEMVIQDNLKQNEDNMLYLYGSTVGHITEETEYIRRIRSTLEKIQNQLYKDDINGKNVISNNEQHNSVEESSFGSRYNQILEKLKDQDLSLVEAYKENEDLQIKLEATREAGSGAIRDATRKLYENYSKKSEDLRSNHKAEQQVLRHTCNTSGFGPETPGVTAQLHQGECQDLCLQSKLRGTRTYSAAVAEHEETFKKSVEKLHNVAEKIEEKHGRIVELENLMKRMEEEKLGLLEKQWLLENEISRRMLNPGKNGCVNVQIELCTTQEQITHLQHLMMAQHQSLGTLIQEREELKNRLQEQDDTIENLREKINLLEFQNKELKGKVEKVGNKTQKISKGTSVKESMLDTMSPYFMLRNTQNKLLKGTEKT